MPFLKKISLDALPDDGAGHPFDLPAVAALRHGLELHPKVTLILAYPESYIYRFDETGIERVELRDTDHYRMTKRFLDAPERMMEQLLADEEE